MRKYDELRRHLGRVAAGLVLLGALGTQVAHMPAAGATTETVRVSATTASSVSLTKTKSVDCPLGKKVVGTAFDVVNGNRQVRINSVVPTATGVTVGAAVDLDGYAGSWALTATAVCTSKPLNGYEVRAAYSAFSLANPKAATATCTDGKQLLGTGGLLFGSATGVVFEGIIPNSTTDSVTARAAHGQVGPAGNWMVGAVAICATLPLTNWVSTVTASTPYNSDVSKSVTAACPSGSVLTGMGGRWERELGIVAFPGPPPPYPAAEVDLDQFTANGSSSTFPTVVTVWANEDQDGTSAYWRVTAYALCYHGDFLAPA